MPTIELARLKVETAQLAVRFSQPEAYVQGVVHLLQHYSMPVHRQGRIRGLRFVLMSYEVPPPLMKHLQFEMALQAEDSPEPALLIADGLWAERSIETRQLAVRLLGAIDSQPAEIMARLEMWAKENQEPILVPELEHEGTRTLAAKYPDQLVEFAKQLLGTKDALKQGLALGALQSLLIDTRYSNLPLIFDLLAGAIEAAERHLRPNFAELLSLLARRSPQETEYFLQQCLSAGAKVGRANQGTAWIARQAMKALPEDSRVRLHRSIEA
ncbi:MAG: DNA alkylation repair protein [Anaerolineales bacterium]